MFHIADDVVTGDNGRLSVAFDRRTGAIRRLENRLTGQVLLDGPGAIPWRLSPQSPELTWLPAPRPKNLVFDEIRPTGVDISVHDSGLTLAWTTSESGVSVRVDVRLAEGSDLELRPSVAVAPGVLPPASLTYPVLESPMSLSDDSGDDRLAFPAHSGLLLRDPLRQPELDVPYPDGYHGCSVQFMCYYAAQRGGFYMAAHDGHSTWKRLRFGPREWSVQHETWDLRPGSSLDYGYPIVIAPLTSGDWYEGADRYRSWALKEAPWCLALAQTDSQVPTGDEEPANRENRRWLHEEVGLSLWGPPSSLDWSRRFERYAEIAGTPLHITSGWDWPGSRPHTVGSEGWFPAKFHDANMTAWAGHYVTPYMNDLFVSWQAADFMERWEPELIYPYATFNWATLSGINMPGGFNGSNSGADPALTTSVDFFVCPHTAAQRELHAWRDAKLAAEYGMAGVCYDISSGNPLVASQCWREEHGHPPGRGRHLIDAYDRVNRRSKAAARAASGRYLVQGVETIIENVIGSVDFYVSRACAGPLGILEAWGPRVEEAPGGDVELIPMFEAVYHDVGPVREDGWLTLSEDEGDLFFWVAARITMQWGGLLALEYAVYPPERMTDDVSETAEVIGWDGAHEHFQDLPGLDPGKAAFVRELARCRTELATPYVGHGKLLRPLDLDVGRISLGFHRQMPSRPRMVTTGSWEVPQVVHGAWLSPEGKLGLLFVNLAADATLLLRHDADMQGLWGIEPGPCSVTVRTAAGPVETKTEADGSGELRLHLELGPREIVLVEVTHAAVETAL